MLYLSKDVGARWFFCRGFNFIWEKWQFVKQSMGLVSPQLLRDIPTPILSIISLKSEISTAVDALPGTPAGHAFPWMQFKKPSLLFSYCFSSKERSTFPSLLFSCSTGQSSHGCSSIQPHWKCEMEIIAVAWNLKHSCPQENRLQHLKMCSGYW